MSFVLIELIFHFMMGSKTKQSYWYENIKLYRQVNKGDWKEPFENLIYDLKKDQLINISYEH
jgi:hypothetical protein